VSALGLGLDDMVVEKSLHSNAGEDLRQIITKSQVR
jgi:hypothetical protein